MTTSALAAIALPTDLSPAQLARVRALLESVDLVHAPEIHVDPTYREHTGVVCHQGGKLSGHHDHVGRVEWIHKSCHRRLHRRGRRRATRRTTS